MFIVKLKPGPRVLLLISMAGGSWQGREGKGEGGTSARQREQLEEFLSLPPLICGPAAQQPGWQQGGGADGSVPSSAWGLLRPGRARGSLTSCRWILTPAPGSWEPPAPNGCENEGMGLSPWPAPARALNVPAVGGVSDV